MSEMNEGSPRAILEIEGLLFGYGEGGTEALRGLTMSVPEGSTTAVLGPNGAGKTTLLHLALGYLAPKSGRVAYAGKPLSAYSRRELGRAVSLVPQSERIPFQYSVREYVTLGRAPYLAPLAMPGPEDERIAAAAIERVGIVDLAERDVTSLSGGERQLASIARSIAQGPKLMLLDEPMSHLDLANKSRVLGIIRSLAATGTTLLFTTHEPEVAAAAASHLVLMRQGRVLASGDVESTLTSEKLSATYGIPVKVERIAGRRVVLWTPRAEDGV
jgi:ABC-type cobalamin/Fe3+-siderophores transport systems, ATPase components